MVHLEESEQMALIHWCRLAEKQYPQLQWIHCSLNGMKFGNIRQATRAKKLGMRKGILDVFLPYPKWYYCPNQCGAKRLEYAGLYIELKRPKVVKLGKGTLTIEQKAFIEYANSVGYKAVVCYGAQEAINVIKEYLDIKE